MGRNGNLAATTFDYQPLAADERSKLIYLAGEAKKQKETHVKAVLEMGRILTDAQAVLSNYKTGTFCEWVEGEIGIPKRTAYNYISAFEHFGGDLCNVAQMELTAMYALTKNEDAKKEAVKLAKKGVEVTGKLAKELIAKAEERAEERVEEEPEPEAEPEPEPPAVERWEELAAIHLDALGHLTQISKLLNTMAEEPHFSHVITRAKGTIKELRASIYQHTPTGTKKDGTVRTRIEERK